MAGAFDVVTASTVEELEEKVCQWYDDAADKGLEDERFPWDPALVKQGATATSSWSGRTARDRNGRPQPAPVDLRQPQRGT